MKVKLSKVVMHYNIRSINKHKTEFVTFLQSLEVNFDIIALTDLGKTDNDSSATFIGNYMIQPQKNWRSWSPGK